MRVRPGSLFGSPIDASQAAFPGTRTGCASQQARQGAFVMWDVVMLALGFGLFVLGIGYAYACERL